MSLYGLLTAIWLVVTYRVKVFQTPAIVVKRLKRTRGRLKGVPQRLAAHTWLTIFLYRC